MAVERQDPETAAMSRFPKIAAHTWLPALVAAVMSYTLLGFSLVPFLIQYYTPRLVAEKLHRQASVREVQFNPYRFTLDLKDLVFNEADGRPILALRRLFLDFDPGEFAEKTYTLAELRLEGPSAHLVIDPQGTLNLARIADDLPASGEPPPPPSDEPPPRVRVKRLILADGSVRFTDRSKPGEPGATLAPIHLELENLSTLPDQRGNTVIEAQLADGGRLQGRGELALNPVAASGELRLDGVKLATAWNFLKAQLNLAEPAGTLALAARYRLNTGADRTDLIVEDLGLKLAGLRLALPQSGEPLLNLEEIALQQGRLDLARQTLDIPAFRIRDGQVRAVLDAAGDLDWQSLVKPDTATSGNSQPTPPAAPADGAAPWRITLGRFEIAGLALELDDASRKTPLTLAVDRLGLSLAAEAALGGPALQGRIADLALELEGLTLAEAGPAATLLRFDGLSLEGGQADLQKREAQIRRAVLQGGGTQVVREADGRLLPVDRFQSRAPEPATGTRATPPDTPAPAAAPWRVAVGEFALQGFALAYTDRGFTPEIAYHLDPLGVSLKNLRNDGTTPVAFDADLKVREGGTLHVSGTAAQTGATAEALVRADRLDLKALQPLVSRYAALRLERADLSTDLKVAYREGNPEPAVTAVGGASVDELRLTETQGGQRFLAWKKLALHGIDFGLAPGHLNIREVRILEPGAKIAIFEDRSTNLDKIFKTGKEPAVKTGTGKPVATPKPRPQDRAKADQAFPVVVERVRIDDGEVDFSDLSLVIPFATRIHDFDGVATGIATAPAERATLKFEGHVDRYGQVKVDGALNPLRHQVYTDIGVIFRNVAMTALSPYSATFAGYKIRSGKLNLDIRYRVDNGRLKNDNQIVLEQFTLGERIESPNATSLPLDLAIALLTDSQGRINASVPVEGNVNDPKFGYGKLVWDAVITLVTKAVTAPFTALASLFGGDGEETGEVRFEPGDPAIPPPELEKLAKTAEILMQRPQIRLTVHGGFDPKRDGAALRSLQLRRALAEKLGVGLKPGEDPGPVAYGNVKTQKAMEALAVERGGAGTAERFQVEFEKTAGRKAQRVGRLTGLFGKASEDLEFYEKLFEHLVATAPLPDGALQDLGTARGQAVAAELVERHKLDSGRVAAGPPAPAEAADDGQVPTRLELGAL
jgi:hypothetical protein